MPYLILAIGLLLGLYALYRFFLNADVRQIKALFMTAVIVVVSLALLLMAFTGKLAAALGILLALAPFVAGYWRRREEIKNHAAGAAPVMTEKEALEVLGLESGASLEEIEQAYKKLMMKVHPDSQGTDWMAAKLNQAREILTRKE